MINWAFEHWFLTFLLTWIVISAASNLISRLFRIIVVTFRGWPPAHLDADGDWKPETKETK